MSNLEQQVRFRYLDRLDEFTWIDDDPSLDFGAVALPYFVAAFSAETSPARRARLVRVIWSFRVVEAFPLLATALGDSSREVWIEALDGIVAIGGNEAEAILKRTRASCISSQGECKKVEWIDEAIAQVARGSFARE